MYAHEVRWVGVIRLIVTCVIWVTESVFIYLFIDLFLLKCTHTSTFERIKSHKVTMNASAIEIKIYNDKFNSQSSF